MFSQEQYQVLIQPTQQKYIKLQILNWNENIIDEIEGICIEGNIDIDCTQAVKRTLDITLVANDNKLIPSPSSKIWLNKKIKVFIGIKSVITDEIVWFNKGIYILFKPSLKYSESERTLSLQALDKMCWQNGQLNGKLQNITKIPVNTPMFDAVKSTIQQLGGENKFIIDDLIDSSGNNLIIPYDIEKSADETIVDVLEEVRDLYMYYDFFYDEDGRFHFQKIKDKKDDMVMWDFDYQNLVLDYANEPNWENIKNDIQVWGNMLEDGTQISYHIENTDDSNMFSVNNIGRRKWVVDNDKVFTTEQAQIRAEYELFQHSNLNETITFSTVPIYMLDVNDKIRITKFEVDIQGEYLIDKISFGLDVESSMSITAHKIYK